MIGRAVTVATTAQGGGRAVDTVVTIFFAAVALNAVTSFLDQWMSTRLAQKVIFDVRRAMFAHFQEVSLSFLDKTHVGRVMSRLQGDVNALQEFLESSTGTLGDLAVLTGTVIILLVMNWKLGLLTMLVLPALIGIRAVWLPYSKKTFRRARDASSIANGALAENINGVRTVQETRREAMNFELYEEKARENMDAQVESAFLAQLMTPTVDILTGFAMAIIIVVGGEQVLHAAAGGRRHGRLRLLRPALLRAGADAVDAVHGDAAGHGGRAPHLRGARRAGDHRRQAGRDRLWTTPTPPSSWTTSPSATIPTGRCCGTSSLKVKPRQVVALVGPTGSGKTSIISLVRRFYEVNEGRVLVGGHDVRDVTLASLGQTIGMVLQEPFLFSGTIEENIRYSTRGDPRAGGGRGQGGARARFHHAAARGLRHPAGPAGSQHLASASGSCCPSPAPWSPIRRS